MIQLRKRHKTFAGYTEFWEHDSKFTKTKMKFSTFRPEAEIKGCLIWLSGLTCTDENFITKAGAQKILARENLMVICPDTSPRGLSLPNEHDSWDFGSGASFYVDATTPGYADHYQMFSYIADEIFEILSTDFQIAKHKISISGHSMGGHGALIFGLRHPERFQAVSAFSPIANPISCPWGQKALAGYLGDEVAEWTRWDATELLRSGHRHPRPLLIDQGGDDEFLKGLQLLPENLVATARACQQPLNFNLREGFDHSYYFIASFIEGQILFHSEVLGKD